MWRNALLLASLILPAQEGSPEPSLEDLREDAESAPADRQAMWRLGHRLWQLGRHDAAADVFRTSTERFGEASYSERMLGACAELGLDYSRAEEHYRRGVRLDSSAGIDADVARVVAIRRDLERFRSVSERLDRDLWIAAGGCTLLLAGGWIAARRRPTRA